MSDLPARTFLGGILIGFALCSLAGRWAAEHALFQHFVRFHTAIGPAGGFYPTASELVSQVTGNVPREKILVLVGGASYFRGSGQNADELWTLELQRLLGDKYAVVNFANDGAGIASFAGVAFQALAERYPKIIYVSSGSPVSPDATDGDEPYRYVFWDAYDKGLFTPPAQWSNRIRDIARDERRNPGGLEMHLGAWIDSLSYSHDLWNYVGYKYFFTVWTEFARSSPARARIRFEDSPDRDLRRQQQDFRNNPDYNRRVEEDNRGFSTIGSVRGRNGEWELQPSAWDGVADAARGMLPEELRGKCYIVLVRSNPYFMRTLSADDKKRLDMIYLLGQRAYESLGYHVVQLPPADFDPDDFLDGGHFMASGGRKVAKAVANRIAEISAGRP